MPITRACKECKTEFETYSEKSPKVFCCKQCREKNWVTANRSKLNETVRRYRKRRYLEEGRWREDGPKVKALREWMNDLKSKPCSDCGGTFEICCMDFDHREGTTKAYNIGSMFAHHYSRELIETELEKCDLVCSNCHRIRTRNRRTGSAMTKYQNEQ